MKRKDISYISPHLLASLNSKTPVLLAFSGGADSSVLLHLLVNDSKKHGFPLSVAHFHHGIRGEEADRDAHFCEELAKKLDIPFYFGRADVLSLAAENDNSVENEGREQRYAFFESVMRENSIPILVTAHHAEDQIESILLHILRGSGLSGLRGIEECRSFADDMYLVRPILRAEKQDILDYCKQNAIEFVTDSTNEDVCYLRNNLRASVTPSLRAIQPNLSKVFSRLSQSASEANDLIEALANEFIDSHMVPIPVKDINSLHKAIRARVISKIYRYLSSATLERTHIESVEELCKKNVPHSSVSLPDNISALIENGNLLFVHQIEKIEDEPLLIPLKEGEYARNMIKIIIQKNPQKSISSSGESIDVRCNLLSDDAHLRYKKDGDVILSGGMHKKVKKLFNEKKVSLLLRNKLPVLVSNEEILWIPTVAACDVIKSDKINDGDDFFRITITLNNN